MTSRYGPLVRCALALMISGVLVFTLSACGSDDDDGAGSSTGSAQASGADDKGVAEAKKILADAQVRPTEIPIKDPIDKPIPKGKVIGFVSCGVPVCVEQGEVIKEAGALLGWTVKAINTNGTPQSYQNAFDSMVKLKPDGVVYGGIDKSLINRQLKALHAAGTVTAACCQIYPEGDGLDYSIDSPTNAPAKGKLVAGWIVASGGAEGKTLYVNIPDFKILAAVRDSAVKDVARMCPKCKVETLSLPITALGKDAPSRIVSWLRSHPDYKQVVFADDTAIIGVPAAIKAAGLRDVKLFGQDPYGASLQYIQDGDEVGALVFDVILGDQWAIVDTFIRKFVDLEVQPSPPTPLWIVTTESYPKEYGNKTFPPVKNFEEQYAKLWGKEKEYADLKAKGVLNH